MMSQLTFYILAHAGLLLAMVAAGIFRYAQPKSGLVEWGNDSLLMGIIFIVGLVAILPLLPA